MPSAEQDLDGKVTIDAGRQRRGRTGTGLQRRTLGTRPTQRRSLQHEARMLDSPAWHLVRGAEYAGLPRWQHAGDRGLRRQSPPAFSRGKDNDRRSRAAPRREASPRSSSASSTGCTTSSWQESLEMLQSRPTVNIEGLVGGYTGPGGKTILPHRAVAKIDLRLVPDMTAAEALAALKGPSGQARLRRHRSQHDRRLRSQPAHPPTLALIQRPGGGLSQQRNRSHHPAAQRRILAGIRLHRRARCTCPQAISAWATAAAPTRPTSTT